MVTVKAKYRRYPTYRASGVEWLGDIPAHWEVRRLQTLGETIIGLTYSPREIVNEEEGILVLRASNIYGGQLVYTDNVFVRCFVPERLIARKGDILICSRSGSRALIGKNARIDSSSSGATFGAFMTVFRSPYNDYIHHVFNSTLFVYQSGAFITSTINQLTLGILNDFKISWPPLSEQRAIVAFLDRETAKIDALVSKKERLAELLMEKRTALISHTVTRGLDPNAPMKDSGVEWLGEIPAHWEAKRLKYLGETIIGLTYSPRDIVNEEEGILVLRASNIYGGQLVYTDNVFVRCFVPERLIARKGDILICSRSGSRALIGKNARIDSSSSGATFGAFMTVFRSPYNDYIHHVFNSTLFVYQSGAFITSTINQLTLGILNDFKISWPPLSEQRSIADFLDRETAKIDNLVDKVHKAIDLLKELRTALISAAVTGKIDVREEMECT